MGSKRNKADEALVLAFVCVFALAFAEGQMQPVLSVDYYRNTCPQLENIVKETIVRKQQRNPTTAAGMLRLFFHDCFVDGCDASVLITSWDGHKAERDADINLSLPGDGFDAVMLAKEAVEAQCPGIVSCADILAIATRDLLTLVGGPFYPVRKGRRDGLISDAARVNGNIPEADMAIDEMTAIFASKGFNMTEVTILSGGHSVGFSHCKEFMARLYSNPPDPTMDPRYVAGLQKACPQVGLDPDIAAFNDVITPHQFDNVYYQNLGRGLGLLQSDQVLFTDPRTRGLVQRYAGDQSAFFRDFAAGMDKLSVVGVKTGFEGEIRRRCDAFNMPQ